MMTASTSSVFTTQERNNNVIAATGKLAKLPCVAKLDNNYFLEWKKEDIGTIYTYYFGTNRGQPTVGFEDRLSHGDDGSLTIHSVGTGDAGVYWCVLKTFNRPADNQIGQKVNLAVHTGPYFVSVPSEEEFREKGQSLSLFCKADGIPQPTVSWLKGNGTVEKNVRIRINGGKLDILHLQEKDAGKYICTATNSVGSKPHATNLRFAEAPVFDEPLKNRTAIDASSLIWKCHAKAVPNALTYRWFYGEQEVIYHQSLGLRASVQGGDLKISKISREDKGWYKCAVTNGFGSVKVTSAYLDVHYPPEISKLTPALQYVPIGLPAAVKCDVDASPSASDVTWTKDGRYLNPDEDERLSVRDNGTRLFIEQVENKDEGLYTCQAFNYLGGGNNYEIHVFVEEPPYYVQEPEKKVTRLKGQEIVLECKAGGKIPPKVSWRRKDGRALPSNAEVFGNKNLKIKDLDARDHGIYQCVVENRVTVLSRDSLLIVEGTVPQSPENVTLSTGPFDAEVSWMPGYSGTPGEIQEFSLKYRKAGDPNAVWEDVYVKNGATRYTVTHLHPDTEYEFVVQPRNSLGPGFAAETVVRKTKGAESIGPVYPTDTSGKTYIPIIERPIGPKPPSPLNLEVRSNYQRLIFTWEAPVEFTTIQYYSLEYKENDENGISHYEQIRRNLGNDNSEEFRSLKSQIKDTRFHFLPGQENHGIVPGETYDFRVKAHSIASYSDPSNTVTYTVPGVSSQMAIVAGIVGGVLFLLLFLLAGCFLIMRGKQKQKRKRLQANHAHSNGSGHTGYPNGNIDTLDVHYATVTKTNGSAYVPDKGVSGVTQKILECFTGQKDSSSTNNSTHISFSSDSLKLPSNYLTPNNRKNNLNSALVTGHESSSMRPGDSVAKRNSNLAAYLSARELKSGHLRGYQSATLSGKHVHFATEFGREDEPHYTEPEPVGILKQKLAETAASANFTPSKSPQCQYTRDKLLGTIDKLRQHVSDGNCRIDAGSCSTSSRHNYASLPNRAYNSASLIPRRQSNSSESATESPGVEGQQFVRNNPGRGAMRHSYSARNGRARDPSVNENQPVSKSFSSSTVAVRSQQQIFNAYMSGAGSDKERLGSSSSSSGVVSIENGSFLARNHRAGMGLPAVLEQTGPSPSVSSSSGISSDEGPSGLLRHSSGNNPITEMLQEKYIFTTRRQERAIDCGNLLEAGCEEEERFKKLREEFRAVKGRIIPSELKATVVESEVL